MSTNQRIIAVATVANLVDGIDVGLLGVFFKDLEAELGFPPNKLGWILLAGGLASSLSNIGWGTMADRMNRKTLICSTMALLGLVTAFTAFVSSLHSFMLAQMFTGMLVAAVTPVTQSLVAEAVPTESRGSAFAMLATSGAISASISAMLVGVCHWRTAYKFMGCLTVSLASVIAWFLPEDETSRASSQHKAGDSQQTLEAAVRTEVEQVKSIFRIPTFLALLLGGVVGCIPWSAMHFFMMYLQTLGFSTQRAAFLITVMSVGKIAGNLVGGNLGDRLARKFPFHGRALLAQISILLGMLILFWVLWIFPGSSRSWELLAAALFAFGLTAVWCNPGVDRPLWAELVEPSCRGKVVAWWQVVAASFGAVFGGPMVGWICVGFLGYDPASTAGKSNAAALAEGMLLCTMLPWALCFCCYSAIHVTYPLDRSRRVGKLETSRLIAD
eukprot:TRINITY_DN42449_c0_g1_i1.p1 TRINITY_DN42449_c0_g1~~TRINITY_DN42449_c0_g1_i1.p1  ORF type:complete len:443 (-),score=65.06 TRINITY_DN42449_c0_g1_i1:19-1347(-)